MKTVTLYINAARTMEIVQEIRKQGWVQGKDFDFSYKPASWDVNDPDSGVTPKRVTFTFYTEKYATFFALKYSNEKT